MRQDVGRLLRGADEHADDTVGHLLLAAHGAAEEHRRRLEDLVLDVEHLVDEAELALHRLVHRRDHLPRRQVRQAPQHGLQALEAETHGDEGCAAEHLVDEDVDVALRSAHLLAEEGRLGAHEHLALVAQLADNPARPVDHGLQQQGALHGAVPLLLRALPSQGRPIGQDRLELVLHGQVADQGGHEALELVAELHHAVLGRHALHEDALLRLQGEVEDEQLLDDVGLDLAGVQHGEHVLASFEDLQELAVALVVVGEARAAHVADALELALEVARQH
mmetsp:Transcript_100072/g.280397  ORF Transcript_100072/g.280397 Transcript_100072/m.280397 type:complete len:278 (-) Transcript_100072:1317-2150(-)